MKKTLLGLFAALALFSFAAPARAAEGEAAGGDKGADAPKKEKKGKKGKKAKEGEAPAGDAAGGEKK